MAAASPTIESDVAVLEHTEQDTPWNVVLFNDPVNLANFVTYVLKKVFGFDTDKAHQVMHQAHTSGKAVCASGPREDGEAQVAALAEHGLMAQLEKAGGDSE